VIGGLAELGVILLMFTLGVEFSLGELRHLWRRALLGGGVQVLATALPASWLAWHFGVGWPESLVLGVAVALSSTAVAMKSFQDLGQPNNPGARMALGVALFQDILVILFILVLPALYGVGEGALLPQLVVALGKGVVFLAGAWLLGQHGLTPLLHAVARTGSRELFTLTVVGICAGIALAGGALDLSLALGAFAAGLVVSESIYAHRIMADILPFKDLFLTVFFVSVGLQIEVPALLAVWPQVLLGTLLIFAFKGLVVFLLARRFGLPLRPSLLAAFSLASMGEFSLVLAGAAGHFRPLDPTTGQLLLACSAAGMGLVPGLMRASSRLAAWCEKRGWFAARRMLPERASASRAVKEIADHAVICGYGPVGQSLNEALRRCGVQTLVVELNVDTVRRLKQQGQAVLFADATHHETMDLASIERARLVAFTFPNIDLTVQGVRLVRQHNPGVCVFARAKFAPEVERLRQLGVQVVHDERESATAMIQRALGAYQREEIDAEDVVREVMG
jgi:CPA2 family monovalent cation:H+ antiporter-2